MIETLEKKILMAIEQANQEYHLIEPGDRILVAVSGGKDSMSLVRMLKQYQKLTQIKFELAAVHVDMGLPDFPLAELIEFFKQMELPYYIEPINILEGGKTMADINCFWCAWNRRKALFRLSEKIGFNKVSFGHHFDDIVETILINMIYRSDISAMCPKQIMFSGRLTLIRPLTFVKEAEIVAYTKALGFKGIDQYKCPNNDTSKRAWLKGVLKKIEQKEPEIKQNIFNSLRRIEK